MVRSCKPGKYQQFAIATCISFGWLPLAVRGLSQYPAVGKLQAGRAVDFLTEENDKKKTKTLHKRRTQRQNMDSQTIHAGDGIEEAPRMRLTFRMDMGIHLRTIHA